MFLAERTAQAKVRQWGLERLMEDWDLVSMVVRGGGQDALHQGPHCPSRKNPRVPSTQSFSHMLATASGPGSPGPQLSEQASQDGDPTSIISKCINPKGLKP